MPYALLACGLIAFVAVLFLLPETSHPLSRGIDKARMIDEPASEIGERKRKGLRLAWVNPLASLWLLRSPNLLIVVGSFWLFFLIVNLISLAEHGGDVCASHRLW
jgi:hypothetical protein